MGGLLAGRLWDRKPVFWSLSIFDSTPQRHPCRPEKTDPARFPHIFEKSPWQIVPAFVLAHPTLRQRSIPW
jgi:hypothetical protein